MKRMLFLLIVFLFLFFNTACTNDEVISIESPKESIEILEQKEVKGVKIYKIRTQQPETPIIFDNKQLEDTINPQAIFEISEYKDGTFSTKLLEINYSSNQHIQVKYPKTWNRVEGREHTFSQLINITNSKIPYDTAGIIELTVVSPKNIDIQMKY